MVLLHRSGSSDTNDTFMQSVIFFFSCSRRHTSWPRDWSSDVCSSDLPAAGRGVPAARGCPGRCPDDEIGRASCRERVLIRVVAGSLYKKGLTFADREQDLP